MPQNGRDQWPDDPVAAVVHPNPYPYYDDLTNHPIAWNDRLGLWVAASADDASAVLGHPAARVRPIDQTVPGALARTPAGDVFGRLVRMNDRPDRAFIKDAIVAAIDGITPATLDTAAASSARRLVDSDAGRDGAFLDRWCAEFPVRVVAHLTGVDDVDAAVLPVRTLAACFGPAPPSDAAEVAPGAVGALRSYVEAAIERRVGLAGRLCDAVGPERAPDAVANIIGLFFQTFDSTTGLVGNTLVGRARRASVIEPSVHNTRRFFAEAADIGAAHIAAGDAVLVVLAAASLPFGAGVHQCPASALAPQIATRAVESLLDAWPGAVGYAVPSGYRPLPNARVPVFG